MGFLISGLVILSYIVLITRSIKIAKNAKDDTGTYIVMGVVGILFFHMLENIGMTIGLLPITGVPLPFVSYGGSAMITNFILLGLIINVGVRKQKIMFIEEKKSKNVY